MAAVSAVAHEMIHQYDNENLDALADMIYARELGVEYDPHGRAFTKMMDFINAKHGLAIVKTFSLHGMDKELSRAIASAWKKANPADIDEADINIMDAHARIDSNVSMEQIDDNIVAVEVE